MLGLAAQPESHTVISYSDHKFYSWNVHKFLLELISLGCTISGLAHTTHPGSPRVVVATTDDAVVRLVSPVNGHVITTALLPVTSRILSVAAAAHAGMCISSTHPYKDKTHMHMQGGIVYNTHARMHTHTHTLLHSHN